MICVVIDDQKKLLQKSLVVRKRDATEPNVLVDTVYKGRPAKLLLHADRNGFLYVLDRTTGEVLIRSISDSCTACRSHSGCRCYPDD
jgi:hypothetical protein